MNTQSTGEIAMLLRKLALAVILTTATLGAMFAPSQSANAMNTWSSRHIKPKVFLAHSAPKVNWGDGFQRR
jgi:hypothetical protein